MWARKDECVQLLTAFFCKRSTLSSFVLEQFPHAILQSLMCDKMRVLYSERRVRLGLSKFLILYKIPIP